MLVAINYPKNAIAMIKFILFLIGLFCATTAFSIEPFIVKDIRIEGLQRTEAGTVFARLPFKVGERIDNSTATRTIKSLYNTGFF